MARQAAAGPAPETVTLSDSEIVSERGVTRRSLLGAMGIGAGAAATAIFAAAGSAPAAEEGSKKKTSKKTPKKPKEETDKD